MSQSRLRFHRRAQARIAGTGAYEVTLGGSDSILPRTIPLSKFANWRTNSESAILPAVDEGRKRVAEWIRRIDTNLDELFVYSDRYYPSPLFADGMHLTLEAFLSKLE